jgi:hypothetical protein
MAGSQKHVQHHLPSGASVCEALLLLSAGAVMHPSDLLREIAETKVEKTRLVIDKQATVRATLGEFWKPSGGRVATGDGAAAGVRGSGRRRAGHPQLRRRLRALEAPRRPGATRDRPRWLGQQFAADLGVSPARHRGPRWLRQGNASRSKSLLRQEFGALLVPMVPKLARGTGIS